MTRPAAATLTLTAPATAGSTVSQGMAEPTALVPASTMLAPSSSQRDAGTRSDAAPLAPVNMDHADNAINQIRQTVSGVHMLEELMRKNLFDALALANLGKTVHENAEVSAVVDLFSLASFFTQFQGHG